MFDRSRKLRWRRRVKRGTHQAQEFGQQAERGLDKYFFRRLNHVVGVRRFIFTWVLLLILLSGGVVAQMRGLSRFYQDLQPAAGGTYTEGVVGAFTNASPLYATGSVDATVSRLVFSSLMQYDSNNDLVGDLAKKLDANESADEYTITLRDDVYWHDGQQLTAEDVVFTVKTIQNPDAKSPLLPNWQNVKAEVTDDYTVRFVLPHGLASFPHTLTSGIVPKHVLEDVPASRLRSAAFNTVNPVGSGPFRWEAVQVEGTTPETRQEQVGLVKNADYFEGEPLLDRFTVRTFRSQESLQEAIAAREVTGAAGLDVLSDEVKDLENVDTYDVPLMGEVMVFLRNDAPFLNDKKVRQALTRATNTGEIIKGLGYPVIKADSLLLKNHVGYQQSLAQLGYNPKRAKQLLNEAGWSKVGQDGIRQKDGKPLTVRLYSRSTDQYSYVASTLQKQWREVGVKLDVQLQSDEELQSTIAFHNYDALLYGITLGSDPDIYAYWHSSQADVSSEQRLNLSEYKSDEVDTALEGGRSRTDPKLRALKYEPMLKAWREDAPAIALYQPRFLYVTTDTVYGFDPTRFNAPTDRFANVQNWAIREERVTIE